MLLGLTQPRIERQDFRVSQLAPLQVMMHIANVPLAGQKYQYIPGHGQAITALLALNLLQHLFDLPGQFLTVSRWAIAHFHRESPPGYFQHWRITEVIGKAFMVDGGRGNNELEIGALRQQLLEIAEQKIDIQAALVGLIDDQGVVVVEKAIPLDLIEQHAIGKYLDQAGLADLLGKAHLEAHGAAERTVQLFRYPACHRSCRQAPWLGVTDGALDAPPQLQADLG